MISLISNKTINAATVISISIFLMTAACSKKNTANNGGSTTTPVVSAEVTINATETHQTIRGFGCATVFNPPNTTAYTAEEFDRLFGAGTGQVGGLIILAQAGDIGAMSTVLAVTGTDPGAGAKPTTIQWTNGFAPA